MNRTLVAAAVGMMGACGFGTHRDRYWFKPTVDLAENSSMTRNPPIETWLAVLTEVEAIGVRMRQLGLRGGTESCQNLIATGLQNPDISRAETLQSMRLVKGRLLSAIEREDEWHGFEQSPDCRRHELNSLLDRMRNALLDLADELLDEIDLAA